MPSLNEATIIGHLGKDPELRFTQKGTGVCNFSVATSQKWGDNESTEWHRIVVWDTERNKQAQRCAEYLAKGRLVRIRGRIQTREWEGKDGSKQRTTEIVADNFNGVMFLDKAQKKQAGPDAPNWDNTPDGQIPF